MKEQSKIMVRIFPHSTAQEFLEQESPRRIIAGVKCYGIKQVMKAVGVDRRTLVRWINNDLLEKLGISHVKDPLSRFNYFREEDIKSLYKNYIEKCLNSNFQ